MDSGGKRLRPLITLFVSDLFTGNITNALSASAALEIFHNFTLAHDDIMDNSIMRRGKKTINSKWDNNTGILSGDVMLIISYEILNKRIGKVLHFAYPYGRFSHFNKQAFDLVFKAGFTSCATAERGCHVAADRKLNPNELLIRRDHVICDWNINHVLYFILNNSEKASDQTNLYPNHD